MGRSIPKWPRTPKEAQQRSHRKLKALRNRAHDLLYEVSGLWDEGIISGSIDTVMADLDAGLDAIEDAIREEMQRAEDEGALWE
ncbi:hypothetical protein [Thalassococcus sp. S3]|uniref:hypothetical protein n=1 Tax=Thalassococcus sp. S3 TaxID=2017482 RepID=UPI001023FFD7|nr:hypothetical protein [Thalassococcus sp. S3]QBF31522.1 hypothetical protein CFI11_09875 [Thalassococcus sp. S3]